LVGGAQVGLVVAKLVLNCRRATMAEDQPAKWTLFCIVVDEDTPFPVKIQPDATVGDLKDAIKKKKQPEFDDFAADKLKLYLINIRANKELSKNVNERIKTMTVSSALDPTEELSELFSEAPAKKTVHILVQAPALGK